MKTRCRRVALTVAAIAGSVALYGCGGGDSGPDRTPFNQTDVDRAAAESKAQAETRADAVAKALAAAGKAATEAQKAKDAATAAAAAATAAAAAATTAGLSVDEAMKQRDEAGKQSGIAATAATAAAAAASDAVSQAARHMDAKQHSDAAMASSNAAKASADMAAASATAATRSYGTAVALKGDRDATAGLAAAAGVHAAVAMKQAGIASDEAEKAMAQVKVAKEATKSTDAEAARTDATTARNAAMEASEAAEAAAKKAEAIVAEAPAVKDEQKAARAHADAAAESLNLANRYLAYTAGYADAREARERVALGQDDLKLHAFLKARVKWIDDVTKLDKSEAPRSPSVYLEDAAKDARNAAERLEGATNEDVINARRSNIASALSMAITARNKAGEDLAAAIKAYDAAKPFSEFGNGPFDAVDAERLRTYTRTEDYATGNTYRHTSGMLSLDGDATRVFAVWQPITSRDTFDVVRDGLGVVSLGETFKQPASTSARATHAMYQVHHYDRWKSSSAGAAYDYVSYGFWAKAAIASQAFEVPTAAAPDTVVAANATKITGLQGTFVFARTSDLSASLPVTGTATYEGNHVSHANSDAGSNGQSTNPTFVAPGLNPGSAPAATMVEGKAAASIDFVSKTASLMFDNGTSSTDKIFYDVTGIKLTGNLLSGGTYRGRNIPLNASGRRGITSGTAPATRISNDPLYHAAVVTSGTPPTAAQVDAANKAAAITLHGGVFGDRAQEVAGTIHLLWRKDPSPAAGDEGRASPATVVIHTAFGARNDDFRQ